MSGATAAGELIKALVGVKSGVDVAAKAIELQNIIISLQGAVGATQSANAELNETIKSLKEKLAQVDDFQSEVSRYQLTQPWTGSIVYALKESMSEGEPPHYLCTACYQNKRKSILNCAEVSSGWTKYVCPQCKASLDTGYRGRVPAKYALEVP